MAGRRSMPRGDEGHLLRRVVMRDTEMVAAGTIPPCENHIAEQVGLAGDQAVRRLFLDERQVGRGRKRLLHVEPPRVRGAGGKPRLPFVCSEAFASSGIERRTIGAVRGRG